MSGSFLKGLVVLTVALAGSWFALERASSTAFVNGSGLETEFDCPHDPGPVRLAGSQAAIPEYNDCQSFLNQAGDAYLGRTGIYVREGLGSLPSLAPQPCIQTVTRPAPSGVVGDSITVRQVNPLCVPGETTVAIAYAVAVVRSWQAARYGPLGIEPEYNCLYLGGVTGLSAWMVPIGGDQSRCDTDAVAASTLAPAGTELQVIPHDGTDVPGAGRWAWDQDTRQQYIVMACPGGWCEIGPKGFKPSEYFEEDNAANGVLQRPEWANRPANDVQRLALGEDENLTPGEGWGLAAPDLAAAELGADRFEGVWHVTATIALTSDAPKYDVRLNLKKGKPAPVMTTVQLCRESGTGECRMPRHVRDKLTCGTGGERWYALITSHKKKFLVFKDRQYQCAIREDHGPNANVPATARWRWYTKDETIWTPCGSGCCRVNTDEF